MKKFLATFGGRGGSGGSGGGGPTRTPGPRPPGPGPRPPGPRQREKMVRFDQKRPGFFERVRQGAARLGRRLGFGR